MRYKSKMKKIEKINRTNQIIMRMSIAAKALLNSTHNSIIVISSHSIVGIIKLHD